MGAFFWLLETCALRLLASLPTTQPTSTGGLDVYGGPTTRTGGWWCRTEPHSGWCLTCGTQRVKCLPELVRLKSPKPASLK